MRASALGVLLSGGSQSGNLGRNKTGRNDGDVFNNSSPGSNLKPGFLLGMLERSPCLAGKETLLGCSVFNSSHVHFLMLLASQVI